MPTSYTSLLGLALPVTGELSGTWGDTVNDYITQYVDASVAGTQLISGSQTAVTLTVTTATSLTQVGSGATGSAQYAVINCTGNPAGLLTITAPASSRQYLIINATSTNQSVKIVGAGPTTGVTLVAGEKAVVAWDGADFTKIATSVADGVTTLSFGTTGLTPSTATSGAVTVAGTLAVANGGTGVTTSTGSGSVVLSNNPALTTPNLGTPSAATLTNATGLPLSTGVTGTLAAANGGTGQNTYATGDTLYASGATTLSKLSIGSSGQVLTVTGGVPAWATPASGLPSQTGNAGKYLTTDGVNASWSSTGAAAGGAIYVNNTTISQDYTIASGQNGFSVGPMTIVGGYTVTISPGQRWVVL